MIPTISLQCGGIRILRPFGSNSTSTIFNRRNTQKLYYTPQFFNSSSIIVVSSSNKQDNAPVSVKTAAQAVELGLEKFQSGDAATALGLFLQAQQLNPSEDELCAALYNSACAYTKLKRWQEAADAVFTAVDDYNLKLVVALKDPDLAPLRERREWSAALSKAASGISDEAYVKLRTEAKAPFRLLRIILFGGLAAGAGLGLIIIITRLIAAVQGGDGAPDLQETAQNFAINAAAVGILSFLLLRDLDAQRKDQDIISREESLGALQVSLQGGSRVVPLAAFRGNTRPVIVAGSKGQVSRALSSAEPFKQELRARGVSLIPVVLSDDDYNDKLRRLKAELSTNDKNPSQSAEDIGAGGAGAVGFGASSTPKAAAVKASTSDAGVIDKADRKWQLDAVELSEWQEWLVQQAKNAGVKSVENTSVYVQVQLDGSVRASGVGTPPWRQFLDDIPEMDSVRTKLTDGRGMV